MVVELITHFLYPSCFCPFLFYENVSQAIRVVIKVRQGSLHLYRSNSFVRSTTHISNGRAFSAGSPPLRSNFDASIVADYEVFTDTFFLHTYFLSISSFDLVTRFSLLFSFFFFFFLNFFFFFFFF